MVSAAAREDPWAPWIESIAAGENEALAALYDASSSVVFGVAVRMLNDRADAEEVALDVHKYVWRTAGTPAAGSFAKPDSAANQASLTPN